MTRAQQDTAAELRAVYEDALRQDAAINGALYAAYWLADDRSDAVAASDVRWLARRISKLSGDWQRRLAARYEETVSDA